MFKYIKWATIIYNRRPFMKMLITFLHILGYYTTKTKLNSFLTQRENLLTNSKDYI